MVILFSEEEKAVYNATESGDLKRLKVLLETREDKNPVIYESSDGIRSTILHEAARKGKVNIIKWYHETLHINDINPLDSTGISTPMMWAAQEGELNVTQYYIEAVQGG